MRMADAPLQKLKFDLLGCLDCGRRIANLPVSLPNIGDDFDWRARDYDRIRLFMLGELIARFPERLRWTPADIEVVIVEILAAVADQLSDMADRVAQEGTLETARRPESVRRLLGFIGYDAALIAAASGLINVDPKTTPRAKLDAALESFWYDNPFAMDQARREGPEHIFEQERMVTVADCSVRIDDHPLVVRANASSAWTGGWNTMSVAVILPDTAWRLDDTFDTIPRPPVGDRPQTEAFERRIALLKADIEFFHRSHGLTVPDWSEFATFRNILTDLIDAYRMVGQPTVLLDAVPVGISIVVSLIVRPTFYQSEIRSAAEAALGKGTEGFFAAGRLRFGEDVFASDVLAKLMDIEGIENVCLIRFKRVGRDSPDMSEVGRIVLNGLEVAVCDNDRGKPARGYFSLIMHGGMRI
jgi:hypothetical protein